jgi:hypothetical protein
VLITKHLQPKNHLIFQLKKDRSNIMLLSHISNNFNTLHQTTPGFPLQRQSPYCRTFSRCSRGISRLDRQPAIAVLRQFHATIAPGVKDASDPRKGQKPTCTTIKLRDPSFGPTCG